MNRFFRTILSVLVLTGAMALAQNEANTSGDFDKLQTINALSSEGKFFDALNFIETTGTAMPGSALEEAKILLDEHLQYQKSILSRKSDELSKATTQTTSLMEIALLNENDTDTFSGVRDSLRDIRKIIVDLLAAGKVEENITSEKWMQARIAEDKLAIKTKLDEIKVVLLPDNADAAAESDFHSQTILAAINKLEESLDSYEAEADKYDWSKAKAARNSIDLIADTADQLAESMDWLSSLVSEVPWQEALNKLLSARLIAFEHKEILEQDWAKKTIEGAEARAAKYSKAGKYYKALSLYSLLNSIYSLDNDIRYRRDETRVTRQAMMMAMYAKPDKTEYDKYKEDQEKTFDEILAQHEKDWHDHIRGVDFTMASIIFSRVHDSYVRTPDFADMLDGAIAAVQTMLEIPRMEQTFTGLQDEQAKQKFLDLLADYRQQAKDAAQLDYRHVNRTLQNILRQNVQTVNIPQEVIDIEFTNGALGRLDKHTQMFWPNEWKEFYKQVTGNFKGVGIQIQQQRETDYIVVVSPLENSPAYRAGIQADDLIIKVDGEDAKGLETDDAVEMITGPAGTKVTLTIKRPGKAEPMDFELTREEIRVQTVKGWKRTEGENWDWIIDPDFNIGYARITSFTQSTVPGLRDAILEMKQNGAAAIVLDLRGNPGGMLPAAIGVTDEFVKTGTIVSTRGRSPEEPFYAGIPGGFESGPLVVLVNEYSASAAEIVSGALKDLDRATIVGRRSYGKGSVQNLIPIRPSMLSNLGPHLKLTTAHYYLPSGRCLHRLDGQDSWGVEPDVTVAVTPRQSRQWQLMRRRTEIIKDWDFEQLSADMAKQLDYDSQLQTALLLCKLQLLAQGEAVQVDETEEDTNIAATVAQ